MVVWGVGYVLNVGLIVGFMFGLFQVVYFVIKVFVNFYLQVLNEELWFKGVKVMVLVFGYVEMEFVRVVDFEGI